MVRSGAQGEEQTCAIVVPVFGEEDVKDLYSLWKFFLCAYGMMPLEDVDPILYGESVDSAVRQAKALREDPTKEKAVNFFLDVIHPPVTTMGALLQLLLFSFAPGGFPGNTGGSLHVERTICVRRSGSDPVRHSGTNT